METKEINKAFARSLKYYLAIEGITQAELAKRLQVSPATVSDWINAKKSPRLSKVDAMCKMFNCTRSAFLDDKVEKLSEAEKEILNHYRLMNDRGKEMVIEFIRMASKNDDYRN